MKLSKILAEKKKSNLIDIKSDAFLKEVAALMCTNKVGVVLVYESEENAKKYVGIISDSDLISALCKYGDISSVKVSDVMTRNMIVATSEDDVDYMMKVMMRHKISHLPVIENKKLVAVVSMGDIIRELYQEDEIKIRYYGDYLGATYKSDVF